jgi:tetratricopeptide (TPR) repeat protein
MNRAAGGTGDRKMKVSLLMILLVLPLGPQTSGDLDKAIGLYGKGEFQQAVDLLQLLSESSLDNADTRLWLGKSYLKIGQWDKAVQEIEKAVRLKPSDATYHLWLGRACGARASHSFFLKAPGWAHRVLKEFEKARDLAPENLDVRFDLLDFYLNAPGFLGGGKAKAEVEAEAISELDPRKGYTARATIFEKDKKWDQARKELIQATVEYPNYPDAFKDLADYLLRRKDFKDALFYAKKTLELDSDSKGARLIVAASEIGLHANLDQAAATLRELAAGTLGENDPAFETVYYWLGECYLAQGKKAEARRAFKSALEFNPDYSEAKEGLSRLR